MKTLARMAGLWLSDFVCSRGYGFSAEPISDPKMIFSRRPSDFILWARHSSSARCFGWGRKGVADRKTASEMQLHRLMPVNIYRVTLDGEENEKIAWLCEDE